MNRVRAAALFAAVLFLATFASQRGLCEEAPRADGSSSEYITPQIADPEPEYSAPARRASDYFTPSARSLPAHAGRSLKGRERIASMDVVASFDGQGRLEISERITVEARGQEIRRGLVRVLPTTWLRQDGRKVRVAYSVDNVLRNGRPEPWETQRAGTDLEILLGDDTFLEHGMQEYVINYSVSGALLSNGEENALYWNVTGHDWSFEIEEASFQLQLPDYQKHLAPGPDDRFLLLDYFTGRLDGTSADASLEEDGTVRTTRALRPGEGLTVYFSWPRGIVPEEEGGELSGGLSYLLRPTGETALAALPTLLLLGWFLFFHRRWADGRYSPRVIPLFEVPEEWPGLLRCIGGKDYDNKALGADILYLISRKRLFRAEIEEGGKRLEVLSPFPEPGKAASLKVVSSRQGGATDKKLSERLLKAMFPENSDALELRDSVAPTGPQKSRVIGDLRVEPPTALAKVAEIQRSAWRQKRKKLLYPFNSMFITGMTGWLALTLAAACVLRGHNVMLLPLGMVMLIFPMFAVAMPFLIIRQLLSGMGFASNKFVITGYGVAAMLVLTGNIGNENFLGMVLTEFFGDNVFMYSPPGLLLVLLCGLCVGLWALVKIPRRTREGQIMLSRARGLKMYLKTAERHRFEALYPQGGDVEHFEALLPYAMALGVGKTWADSFAEYCRKAGLPDQEKLGRSHFGNAARLSRSVGRSARVPSSGNGGRSGGRSSSRSFGGGRSGRGAGGGGGRGR